MEHPLGTYIREIVWIRPCVGVWRFECKRCGLVVQNEEGTSDYESKAHAAERHVCDPSKLGRMAFDPTKPYTHSEKIKAALDALKLEGT